MAAVKVPGEADRRAAKEDMDTGGLLTEGAAFLMAFKKDDGG
ncbi:MULTISPECIES: hypothetical protein [unclassified Spirillospora]